MYISYNVLKDFLKFPKSITAEEIASRLTKHTVEVEGISRQSDNFDGVIVGKVLSVEKHPNADRLRLAEIDIKSEKLRIVCGAPNLEKGQLVPVATIGAILPGNFEIKESEIRGEKSCGMICAEDELGLGENHEGIMVLDKSAKIGQPFSEYLGLDDVILEVDNKSLSNRPDLLSHYGIAREISAIFNLELKDIEEIAPAIDYPEAEKLEVKIEDKDSCPRYMAIRVDNVEIKESPAWLKNCLSAIGQKPINNIVDITNYVMFELGQPMHAFDADKVKKIVVRPAGKNEKIETLDDKDRILDENDLVITDGKTPLAIAGVIGGQNSGISGETKSIILESANFKASSIRRTAQKFRIRTEASVRFEKSIDPELPPFALARYIAILKESCPDAKISSSLTDIDNHLKQEISIELSFPWLFKKIGQEIDKKNAIKFLEKLGFVVQGADKDTAVVLVPSWRATKDIKQKEDLVEEVLRLYGYDNIVSRLPEEEMRLPIKNVARIFERKIKNILSLKHSLSEVYNYSFVGDDQLNKLGIDPANHLRILNPLSEIHSLLRQSLIPNLAFNIRNNQFKAESIGLFELGGVFFNAPGEIKKDDSAGSVLPYQETKIAIALAGGEKNELFVEVKGIIESLIRSILGFKIESEFLESELFPAWAESSSFAKVIVLGREVGFVSLMAESSAKNIGLKKSTAFAELDFKTIFSLYSRQASVFFCELSKYPAVTRDYAFVVGEKILYNEIRKEILNISPLIKSVELFDVYSGDKLDAGKKSLAFHISYLSEEATLSSSEVDVLQEKMMKNLEEKFGAKLRDF